MIDRSQLREAFFPMGDGRPRVVFKLDERPWSEVVALLWPNEWDAIPW